MELITSYSDLPSNLDIHFVLTERKSSSRALHVGYKNQVQSLKDTGATTVVDLTAFGKLLQFWAPGKYPLITYQKGVPVAAYRQFFQSADYVIDIPEADLAAVYMTPEVLALRDKVLGKIEAYDTQYEINKDILLTYLTLYEMYVNLYGYQIMKSNNQWKCGGRSYFYKDYLENTLGIPLELQDPPRDTDNMILMDNFDDFAPNSITRIKQLNLVLFNAAKSEIPQLEQNLQTLAGTLHAESSPCVLNHFYIFNGPDGSIIVEAIFGFKYNTSIRIINKWA